MAWRIRNVLYVLGVAAALFLAFGDLRADSRLLSQAEQFAIYGGNIPIPIIEDPPVGVWQDGKKCAKQGNNNSPCYKPDVDCTGGQAYCAESPANRNTNCETAYSYLNPTRCGITAAYPFQCKLLAPAPFPAETTIPCYESVTCKCIWQPNPNGYGWIDPSCNADGQDHTVVRVQRCTNN